MIVFGKVGALVRRSSSAKPVHDRKKDAKNWSNAEKSRTAHVRKEKKLWAMDKQQNGWAKVLQKLDIIFFLTFIRSYPVSIVPTPFPPFACHFVVVRAIFSCMPRHTDCSQPFVKHGIGTRNMFNMLSDLNCVRKMLKKFHSDRY